MTDELLPVGDLDVEIHARVRTSALADCGDSGANCTPNPFWIMDEIEAMRVAEGSDRHYMGLVRAGAAVALVPGKASVVYPDAKTIAHELGHNLSLRHAPCATEGDPDYPHEEGNIGSWGYRSEYGDNGLVPPVTADLMSYCRPAWISGYHFTKALVHRTQAAASAARAATRSPTRSLLLWGRVDRDGSLVLEPAFVVEAPQRLPATAGPYRLAGRNAGGDVVFSHDFQMSQVIAEDAETGRLVFRQELRLRGAGPGGLGGRLGFDHPERTRRHGRGRPGRRCGNGATHGPKDRTGAGISARRARDGSGGGARTPGARA